VFTLDEDLDAVLVNTTTEKPPSPSVPAPEADIPVVRKDDESATETVEKQETPVATTTTLPGVSGTGEQSVTATQAEPGKEPEPESKPAAAEVGNPTVIPSSEHPEDVVVGSFEEIEKPKTPELK
jgi:hypothetical protein